MLGNIRRVRTESRKEVIVRRAKVVAPNRKGVEENRCEGKKIHGNKGKEEVQERVRSLNGVMCCTVSVTYI